MNWTSVALAVFEFLVSAGMGLLVVYTNYRLFIVTNRDYDAEVEMKKNNLGAGILLAALLISGGLIVREGVYPVTNLVRLYFTSPVEYVQGWQLVLLLLGHLGLVFITAVYTISLTLRFWGRMTKKLKLGEELKNGNMAVGVVLGGVVFVMALYVSDGISRLTKALIPQPSIGHVEFAR
ncbi:MAG TPA: DUF350 domain-containing protein [Verrucomicrobiae bacterium]|nr:DUF350 domain-containing protein [Verrucomicrobiae bacterium]